MKLDCIVTVKGSIVKELKFPKLVSWNSNGGILSCIKNRNKPIPVSIISMNLNLEKIELKNLKTVSGSLVITKNPVLTELKIPNGFEGQKVLFYFKSTQFRSHPMRE